MHPVKLRVRDIQKSLQSDRARGNGGTKQVPTGQRCHGGRKGLHAAVGGFQNDYVAARVMAACIQGLLDWFTGGIVCVCMYVCTVVASKHESC